MDKQEAKKRIEVLKKEIDENRYLYHVQDKPRVSDAVDDSLKHELAKLEEQFPELVTDDSPTQRVGGKPLDKFVKVRHSTPMISLNDVFSFDELKAWEARLIKLAGEKKIRESGFYCELKMDGLAVALIYTNGTFTLGATRGDGQVGEDVTNNLKTIESIPLGIKIKNQKSAEESPALWTASNIKIEEAELPDEFEIRGEIYLSKNDFEKLNEEQKKKGGQIYANPRNIAAGSIRQLDPSIAASRNLKFMSYQVATEIGLKNHSEEHELVEKLGFQANTNNNKLCKTIEEVNGFFVHWNKHREGLPYQIDGLVIGINDRKLFKSLGIVGKAPRAQIAFKFAAEEATSVVKNIIVQVGRTGKLTPVAILEPTVVAGSTVSRATLHNEDEINRKDIKIGDTVIIRKAGDVIPEVKEVIKRMRSGKEKKFSMPKSCPVCGGEIVKREGEVDSYCKNKNCAIVEMRQIGHFVSKGAFEIDGLGPKIIEHLITEGLIKDASDIFDLKVGDLEPLERFGEKSAQNIILAIDEKREVELDRFIYSLGIRHVGSTMAMDIAKQFGNINDFLSAKEGDFNKMYGVGDKVAQSIIEYIGDEKSQNFIKRLIEFGVKVKNYHSPVLKNKLSGKTFIVTGTLTSMTREEAHKKIIQFGGEVSASISQNTNYLIVGDEPGSKLDKAKRLGVKIISEKEFFEILK
ncbi:MAG: NAD-dependent DNA ligase LigA [Candidatus Berkelbacteria bacterium]|nr:NAD-dependent DNA ligase LigA [Candidatus Berkelbacteria bacterium]